MPPLLTRILTPTDESLDLVARTLRSGGLVGIPTETVYGLAGSAVDEGAVTSIFAVKERPTFDPLIVHVAAPPGWASRSSRERFDLAIESGVFATDSLAVEARDHAARLIDAFWPGPLTLVLPRAPRIPLLVTSGLDTVAVRMPRHPLAQALLVRAGVPLAAPSANRFGRLSPTTAEDVLSELRGRIPYILDGGPCEVGLESTIVEVAPDGRLTLLRPGGIAATRIGEVAGVAPTLAGLRPGDRPLAPGTLDSHYAPAKPLVLLPGRVSALDGIPDDARARLDAARRGIGLLVFSGDGAAAARRVAEWTGQPVCVRVLSPSGNLEEAARRLFGALRALDASEAEVLLAEPCPTDQGLGHALRDRLKRAAAR